MLSRNGAGRVQTEDGLILAHAAQEFTLLLELRHDVIGNGVAFILAETLPQAPDNLGGTAKAKAMLKRSTSPRVMEPRERKENIGERGKVLFNPATAVPRASKV